MIEFLESLKHFAMMGPAMRACLLALCASSTSATNILGNPCGDEMFLGDNMYDSKFDTNTTCSEKLAQVSSWIASPSSTYSKRLCLESVASASYLPLFIPLTEFPKMGCCSNYDTHHIIGGDSCTSLPSVNMCADKKNFMPDAIFEMGTANFT